MASCSSEIVPGVPDTKAGKASTGKTAAESIATLPVDDNDELETAYDTIMLDCQRIALRENCLCMAEPGGCPALFYRLHVDKEERAWKWKLKATDAIQPWMPSCCFQSPLLPGTMAVQGMSQTILPSNIQVLTVTAVIFCELS